MKKSSYINFFANFSNKTRMEIIELLYEGDLSVNNISEKLNEEQSKISHNLKKLNQCNIVEVKRVGKERIYSLNKKTAIPLLKIVEKHVIGNCANCPRRCR
jgi:ArsR family transcriptional regulator, zinc-responsive transcriptional repressor